jgi:hypothetical protein
MNQPTPRPKTFYYKTIDELKAELAERISTGNYFFSPQNYADQIAYLQAKESADHDNAFANRQARIASRSTWVTVASAIIAAVSATAAVLALTHHNTTPAPPSPVIITQTAPPPAPVTITQTVLPPPPETTTLKTG